MCDPAYEEIDRRINGNLTFITRRVDGLVVLRNLNNSLAEYYEEDDDAAVEIFGPHKDLCTKISHQVNQLLLDERRLLFECDYDFFPNI